jgi:hypothetical protein
MFGRSNFKELPLAARTQQAPWDELVAEIWRSVLTPFTFKPGQVAIEVGPGTSCKVCWALQKVKFNGTVYIVDPAENAIEVMQARYQKACPGSDIRTVHETVKDSRSHLPRQPDFLFMSHVVDDMMLLEAVKKIPQGMDAFEWHSGKAYKIAPTRSYHDTWKLIEKNLPALEAAKAEVLQALVDFITWVNPRHMVISQYPSATLEENGLDIINKHSNDIFQKLMASNLPGRRMNVDLQRILDQNENYGHHHTGNNLLNAKNWFLYEA